MNKLSQVAAMVRKAGAAGSPDTILAHITPKEAAMLKARGGSGRIDPNTGLPHFEDDGSDSTSYGGTQTGGGWSGQSSYSDGINSVGGGHSDPTYNSQGYYSAAGDVDGLDTRYYGFEKPGGGRTIGGEIANSLGYDPDGFLSSLINGGISVSGALNPMVGIVGKIAQAGVGSSTIPSPADMDGNGGSLNMAGRYLTSGKPGNLISDVASKIPALQASPVRQDAPTRFAQNTETRSSGGNSVQQSYEELLRKRKNKA